MSDELELQIAWTVVAGGEVGRRGREVGDELIGRHRQPHRRYHGVRHAVWVVRHVNELADELGPTVDRRVALAAAFFHDAVYDPSAADNERRSAALARTQLPAIGWSAASADHVGAIVEATAHHDTTPVGALDVTTAVVLDADLAVLGADPAAYQAYVSGVRAEYGALDEATWRRGRQAVLTALLARDRLYLTDPGQRRWQQTAGANLAGELAALRAG